jgi:integrase
LHDLRRTAATAMARLNIPPHVVDRLLNHVSGQIRGVAAVYNRHAYIDERKGAIDGWARHLELLLRPVPANLVAINSR